MKIAVTGASGFVGRHVVTELTRRAIAPTLTMRSSAADSSFAQSCRVVTMDIGKADTQDAFSELGKPDILIHLAWGGLPNYMSLHHFETELPAQYRFLRQMIEAGLSNLVVTGTCFEYGMQSGPLSEALPTHPTNPYGHAKDTLRKQLQLLQQQRPFNLTWARLFYSYGDGQAANSLWTQLKTAVQRGEPSFNMSGGEQLRDYLRIEDVAQALVSLALTRRDNGVVNICSGKPISIRSLVEAWITQNNWRIELNLGHYPYPSYEPMAFWGDPNKLAACLDSKSNQS